MAIPKSYPMRFTPKGLVDAYDASDKFPGACRILKDLIFDPANPELVVSRPGVISRYNFSDFSSPGFISVHAQVGGRMYGMVATSLNAGYDQPFCYDLNAQANVPITGMTAGNVPLSPSPFGPWVPPTITAVGVYVIITHPGFDGTGTNFFGVIDLTNFNAPVWYSANISGNPLSAAPQAAANYNDRVYFAVGNQVPYTDVLQLKRSFASQQLAVGDSGAITALSGLPIQTTSSGVVAALCVFKQGQIWQITGDTTTNNLSLNWLTLGRGTSMPRSVAVSDNGIYFCDAGGAFMVNIFGAVKAVEFSPERPECDIQVPFQNCTDPSRASGACSGGVYRVCLPTVISGQMVTNDYWFDEARKRWNGPHSVPYDCACDAGNGLDFIISGYQSGAQLILSQATSDLDTVYTDLGAPQSPLLLSSTFPKTSHMFEKQVVESTQELSAQGGNAVYTITAEDEQGNVLATVTVSITPPGLLWGGGALWGGGGLWASGQNIPHVYSLPWPIPVVFQKMAIRISAEPAAAVQIGTHYARYQDTGYTNLTKANTP